MMTLYQDFPVMLGLKGLFEACLKLKGNTSRKAKEEIIKQYMRYDDFKHLLLFLFDNSVTTGIDIKKIDKDVSSVKICLSDISYNFNNLCAWVSHHNSGRDYDIAHIMTSIHIMTLSDPELVDFLKEVVTKSLRLGIDAKTINKVYGYQFIPTFDVQLGTSIENVKLNGDEEIFISQKLNGTRCVYFEGELWSRNGKKYTGCEHILRDIRRLCNEAWMVHSHDMMLDGELVLKSCGLSDSEAFQKGTGIATSNNDSKEELEYVIFDCMPAAEFRAKRCNSNYKFRKAFLQSIEADIAQLDITNLRIVPFFYEGTDHNKIWEYLDYAEDNDMEGIIVNLDIPYEFKRTNGLIKVKKFHDIDLECIGIEQGEKGKYKDTLGAIICRYKGNEVRVGSGFSEELRDFYFKNPDQIVGKIVSVKYKEATKNKNGTESLQFPVFLSVREDKDTADT